MKALLNAIPQKGKVEWIGLRPSITTPIEVVNKVKVSRADGLVGDRYKAKSTTKRQVTLIQKEHLSVVGAILGKEVDPASLRRNILISGINLLSLHHQKIRIGKVILEVTGYCYPCSKMEAALGQGGYNAMRGHGGITARVVNEGLIHVGDEVALFLD